mmetsp:Transcript_95855/g.309487  ORF Transcript_95855/g.309487 Transcript_95855/m.309487 type:complete len:233 (+) Transcript_95855:55-753(+)
MPLQPARSAGPRARARGQSSKRPPLEVRLGSSSPNRPPPLPEPDMRLDIRLPVFFSKFALRCRSSSRRRSSSWRRRSASSRLRRSSSSRLRASSSSRRRPSSSMRARSSASFSAASACASAVARPGVPEKEPPATGCGIFPGGWTRLPRCTLGLCEPPPGAGAPAMPPPTGCDGRVVSSRSCEAAMRPIFSSRPTSRLQTLPRSCSWRCALSTSCLSARFAASCGSTSGGAA